MSMVMFFPCLLTRFCFFIFILFCSLFSFFGEEKVELLLFGKVLNFKRERKQCESYFSFLSENKTVFLKLVLRCILIRFSSRWMGILIDGDRSDEKWHAQSIGDFFFLPKSSRRVASIFFLKKAFNVWNWLLLLSQVESQVNLTFMRSGSIYQKLIWQHEAALAPRRCCEFKIKPRFWPLLIIFISLRSFERVLSNATFFRKTFLKHFANSHHFWWMRSNEAGNWTYLRFA